MKSTNKQFRRTVKILSFMVFAIILTASCKIEKPTYGCDSETITTIPESAGLIGRLAYKKQLDSNDTYYNNHYWITYIEQNCSNCVHHMIICNDEILGSKFNDLLNLERDEFVEVKFSGHLKEICQKKFDIADVTYEHIKLTSIERK